MKPLDHRRLMELYDGELSPAEVAELESALAADSEAQRVLAAFAEVGRGVRAAEAEREFASEGLTDAIMARVRNERAADKPRDANMAGVRDERAADKPTVVPLRSVPRRRGAVVVSLTLAAAAGALMWVSRPEQAPTAHSVQPVPSAFQRPSAAIEPAEATADAPVDPGPQVAIESVDFGGHTGTIFMVPAGERDTTPVVWLSDEPEAAARPRTERL
jgi:anti-sigma factor RsiW